MTDHEQKNFEQLESAIEAIRSQPISDGPSKRLVTSTVEVLRANEPATAGASNARNTDRPQTRRESMIRLAKYGTLGTAASIAVALAVSVMLSSLGSHSAFAQVIDNIRDATSAKYSLIQKIGDQPTMNCESSFSGDMIRTEVAGQFIYIANARSRETLQLIPSQLLAIRGKAGGNPMQQPLSIADVMREMTEEHGEFVETVTQDDGSKLDLYRLTKLPSFMGAGTLGDGGVRLWVDPETKLPIRIKGSMTMGPQNTLLEMEFKDFEWNPELPAGHFDMTIPDGYQVQ